MDYDVIVIGAGPGGYVAAIKGAQKGLKIALIEERHLGGTCANEGCIPTKVYAHAAQLIGEINSGGNFGINAACSVDTEALRRKKEQVVQKLTGGIGFLLKKRKVDVITGRAVMKDEHTVKVGENEYSAAHFIIAAGSRVMIPPIPGIGQAGIITSNEALALDRIPKKLGVIGAGVIGLELANIYKALGSEVVLVDILEELLPMVDPDIAAAYRRMIESDGTQLRLGYTVKEIKEGFVLCIEKNGNTEEIECDMVLAAAGRAPNINGVDALGLEINKKGIVVDEFLRTKYGNIYCVGDVNGLSQLAHAASYEAEIAIENIVGANKKADLTAVPACVFTHPEIAWVGLTEKEAGEKYGEVYKGTFHFMGSGRALTMGAENGMVKVIAAGEERKIVGMSIIGANAAELIAAGTIAVSKGLKYEDMADIIIAHPTLSETIKEAFEDTRGLAVHK